MTIVEPDVGRLASKGEEGVGRLAEPARCSPPARRRSPSSACGATGATPRRTPGCGRAACSSPPAARASRSTACGSSATAPRGAWASRSRRRAHARGARGDAGRRQRRAGGARRASTCREVVTAAELQQACERGVPALRRAADGRGRRRLQARRRRPTGRSRRPGASASSSSSSRPPTCSPGWPPSAATARRWSASPPSTASRRSSYARGKLARQGPRRDRRQRHLARGHRLRRRTPTR